MQNVSDHRDLLDPTFGNHSGPMENHEEEAPGRHHPPHSYNDAHPTRAGVIRAASGTQPRPPRPTLGPSSGSLRRYRRLRISPCVPSHPYVDVSDGLR